MDAIIRSAAVAGTRQLGRAKPPSHAALAATPPAADLKLGQAGASAGLEEPSSAAEVADMAASEPAAPAQAAEAIARANAEAEAAKMAQQQAMQALQDQLAQAEHALERERLARQADAERARTEVYEDAERRGHAAGLSAGEAEGRELLREQCERVLSVATALAHSKLAVLNEAEDLVVDIAFAALCRVLGDKLVSRRTVATLVAQLVQQEREPELLCVRLHADDLELLLEEGDGPRLDPRIRLQADATIEIGGCIVDSQRGTLDARLDLQLDSLRHALLTARKQRRDTQEAV